MKDFDMKRWLIENKSGMYSKVGEDTRKINTITSYHDFIEDLDKQYPDYQDFKQEFFKYIDTLPKEQAQAWEALFIKDFEDERDFVGETEYESFEEDFTTSDQIQNRDDLEEEDEMKETVGYVMKTKFPK